MFFAAASQLFAAQRANMSETPFTPASALDAAAAAAAAPGGSAFPPPPTAGMSTWGDHPSDGYVGRPPRGMEFVGQSPLLINMHAPTPNTAKWVQGAQWAVPPMDALIFLGSGGLEIKERSRLGVWFASVLNMSVQAHTDAFFADARAAYNTSHLLCSRRGAFPSQKPKLFTSLSDGWMFRQYAYQNTGLTAAGILTHGMYPPRRITILDRKGLHGRGIFNRDEVIEAAQATGLEVVLVGRMDHMTFAQQVSEERREGYRRVND